MLVSDARYCVFLTTAMASILKNAAPEDRIRFHIVDAGLVKSSYDAIVKLTSKRTVRLALVKSSYDAIEKMKELRPFEIAYYKPDVSQYVKPDDSRFPTAIYYRLLAPQFLPESLDKIVYMDVDVAVLSSLRELWETPVDGVFVAAAVDRLMAPSHVAKIGLDENAVYFNSGLLVMNLKKWREDNVMDELFKLVDEMEGRLEFPDQDLLNVYASRNGYKLLSEEWNVHPKFYEEGKTKLLHYMGSRYNSPHIDILCKYAALTPFKRLPFQSFTFHVRYWIRRIICQFLCLFLIRRRDRHVLRKIFYLRR